MSMKKQWSHILKKYLPMVKQENYLRIFEYMLYIALAIGLAIIAYFELFECITKIWGQALCNTKCFDSG